MCNKMLNFFCNQFSTAKFQIRIFVSKNFHDTAKLDNILQKAKTEVVEFIT